MKNSVLEVDPKRYGRLLARKLPAIIRTEEENERLIAELEELDRRHDEISPEEREYAELLTVLIEAFEDANYALEGSTPDSRLRSLMGEFARDENRHAHGFYRWVNEVPTVLLVAIVVLVVVKPF